MVIWVEHVKSEWLAASLAGFELISTREGVLPKSHVSSMSVLNSTPKRSETQLGYVLKLRERRRDRHKIEIYVVTECLTCEKDLRDMEEEELVDL